MHLFQTNLSGLLSWNNEIKQQDSLMRHNVAYAKWIDELFVGAVL